MWNTSFLHPMMRRNIICKKPSSLESRRRGALFWKSREHGRMVPRGEDVKKTETKGRWMNIAHAGVLGLGYWGYQMCKPHTVNILPINFQTNDHYKIAHAREREQPRKKAQQAIHSIKPHYKTISRITLDITTPNLAYTSNPIRSFIKPQRDSWSGPPNE